MDGVAQRERQAPFRGFDVVRANVFQAFLVGTESDTPSCLDGAGRRVLDHVDDRLRVSLGDLSHPRPGSLRQCPHRPS